MLDDTTLSIHEVRERVRCQLSTARHMRICMSSAQCFFVHDPHVPGADCGGGGEPHHTISTEYSVASPTSLVAKMAWIEGKECHSKQRIAARNIQAWWGRTGCT